MCGIVGQYNFGDGRPVDEDQIRAMTRSIIHRGPDDEGYFFSGSLGLGFRRLSIIDLSGGHQPMSDRDEKVWVVFNGEIYNFPELRRELESRGHEFRTSSDTEVIVHGYREWGTGVLNRLNGMFGLAIWDEERRRLVVARDAMGIKLVYYRLRGGNLSFGSEIRPLLATDGNRAEVDPVALGEFLRFRYTPSPKTIFRGIRKLPPGGMLICEDGECREERWYDHSPRAFESPKTKEDAIEELLELYRGAVRRHLLSDVPVGILLSGGLDSGLLLALMNEEGENWPAYTVGYGSGFEDDELKEAEETANLLGARHIPVLLDQSTFEDALPGIVSSLEEPVASSSIVPMYFVCERARQDVKVVLLGQGPDELFGGYKRHLGVRYGDYWRQVPGGIRGIVECGARRLPRNESLKRGIASLGERDRLTRYRNVFSLAPSGRIRGLFREGVLPASEGGIEYWDSLAPQMAGLDELGGFQHLEVRSSLPDELLMYADKLSMAHSLEGRVPYLDREVVEYAQRVESKYKVRHGKGKWLHREVCKRYLHPSILNRKKRGFAVNVVDDWFHSSVEGELSRTLLDTDSYMYELLDPGAVRKLFDDHRSGRDDNHKLLFSLVMMEQWLRGTRTGLPGSVPGETDLVTAR